MRDSDRVLKLVPLSPRLSPACRRATRPARRNWKGVAGWCRSWCCRGVFKLQFLIVAVAVVVTVVLSLVFKQKCKLVSLSPSPTLSLSRMSLNAALIWLSRFRASPALG
ncbi:hypothetical protein L596_005528 [Steinernema carpocapsae]|uniref:Uncharacterized protein n=1 Tax=Steinernema carpocapsae TaxID=34508 RepID=A0A4U8V0H2_STECR|nr:hypothetical protein L596_005528 [Steinernema carpocapsae]